MKLFRIILAISTLSLLASCQPKLTPAEADALKDVAPSAIDVTVQKIGGVGVGANAAPIDLQPFAKLPAVFAKAYSPEAMHILAKTNAMQMFSSGLNATLQNMRPGRIQTMQSTSTGCGDDIFPPDVDADNVPDLVLNYAYDCQSGDNLTTGTITIKDNSPNGAGPYEVHVKQFKVLNNNPQSPDYKVSISLDLDLNLKSTTSPYSVGQGFSFTLKPDDTASDFITVGFSSDSKYTPDDLQNPFNGSGLLAINASFSFSFKLTDATTGKVSQANKTFKLVANVHRNKACVGDVEMDSGTIEFSDNAGGFTRTQFGSCNSKNWTWTNNAK
jgi:hypothetical protein